VTEADLLDRRKAICPSSGRPRPGAGNFIGDPLALRYEAPPRPVRLHPNKKPWRPFCWDLFEALEPLPRLAIARFSPLQARPYSLRAHSSAAHLPWRLDWFGRNRLFAARPLLKLTGLVPALRTGLPFLHTAAGILWIGFYSRTSLGRCLLFQPFFECMPVRDQSASPWLFVAWCFLTPFPIFAAFLTKHVHI